MSSLLEALGESLEETLEEFLEEIEGPMLGIYLNRETSELHRLYADWPDYDPSTSPPELKYAYIVKVVCVGITNGEYKWLQRHANDEEEPVIGFDFAGWVVSAPKGARYKPGTQVYGFTSTHRTGNARSYTRVRLDELWEKPCRLTLEQAATVPLSAVTAFRALFCPLSANWLDTLLVIPSDVEGFAPTVRDKAKTQNGERRILVIGGAGAVGSIIVQLAALAGAALVVATCSRKNMAFVRSIRAYEVVAYDDNEDSQPLSRRFKHYFHAVIDCVGKEALREAWPCVRPGGTLVSFVSDPCKFLPDQHLSKIASGTRGIRLDACFAPGQIFLKAASELISMGLLQPNFSPENVLEFDQYYEINDRLRSKARGKLVLKINNGEPWNIINALDDYGAEVGELPKPEVVPPRPRPGHTAEQVLADYEDHQERMAAERKIRKDRHQARMAAERKIRKDRKGKRKAAAGDPGRVDEDSLLANPWASKPRKRPRGEEQNEDSDQVKAGLGIQAPADGDPESAVGSRRAVDRGIDVKSQEAQLAADMAARQAQEEAERERAERAIWARRLERALSSLPPDATKVERTRVKIFMIRVKNFGYEDAVRDLSGPSRPRARVWQDDRFIRSGPGPDPRLPALVEQDNDWDDFLDEFCTFENKGKQKADYVDYGYQVVVIEESSSFQKESGSIIGVKRPAEGEDNLPVTEDDLRVRKKLKTAKPVDGDGNDVDHAVQLAKQAASNLASALMTNTKTTKDPGPPPLPMTNKTCPPSPLPAHRQLPTTTSLPSPPRTQRNDAHSDAEHLAQLNRHIFDTASESFLPKKRQRQHRVLTNMPPPPPPFPLPLPRWRKPMIRKLGKVLEEDTITMTIVQEADGSVGYKNKSKSKSKSKAELGREKLLSTAAVELTSSETPQSQPVSVVLAVSGPMSMPPPATRVGDGAFGKCEPIVDQVSKPGPELSFSRQPPEPRNLNAIEDSLSTLEPKATPVLTSTPDEPMPSPQQQPPSPPKEAPSSCWGQGCEEDAGSNEILAAVLREAEIEIEKGKEKDKDKARRLSFPVPV